MSNSESEMSIDSDIDEGSQTTASHSENSYSDSGSEMDYSSTNDSADLQMTNSKSRVSSGSDAGSEVNDSSGTNDSDDSTSDSDSDSDSESEEDEESDLNKNHDLDDIFSFFNVDHSTDDSSDGEGEYSDDQQDSSTEQEREDEEEYDPDNPPGYEEPDDLSYQQILSLIRSRKPAEDDNFFDPDPQDLDFADIAERITDDTAYKLIDKLAKDDEKYNEATNFHAIKNLVEAKEDLAIYDISIFDHYVTYAALNNEQEIIDFLIAIDADLTDAKNIAITNDSEFLLESLGVDFDAECLEAALTEGSFKVVKYFLEQDFLSSYEIILDAAIDESKQEFVELVFEMAQLDQIFDLVVYLTAHNGERFIPLFFKYFDAKKILNEMCDQDDGRGFFELVLNHAKDYLSQSDKDEIELQELIQEFDNKLTIGSSLLIYPPESFNGDKYLKKVREMFDKNLRLGEESKLAASFIGVNLSTANQFFVKHPKHKTLRKHSEHYFRSDKHPFSGFVNGKNAPAQYTPEESLPEFNAKKTVGGPAHLGLYKTPLDSLNNVKKIKPGNLQKKRLSSKSNSKLYDGLLKYKHAICNHIASSPELKNVSIKVGFYHKYPCLMVHIRQPARANKSTPAALEAWTQIVISFFVGLVNYEARKGSIDIELVRRSSFGFLTPTISPCGPSLRINVGAIPQEYADLLIKCLKILDVTLYLLNKNDEYLNSRELDVSLPKDCFVKGKQYKKYMSTKKIPEIDSVLDLVWAKVDKGGRTGALNLMRTAAARDGFAIHAYNSMVANDPQNVMNYAQTFLDALQWGFGNIDVQAGSVQFDQTQVPAISQLELENEPTSVDKEFFSFISYLISCYEDEHEYNPLPADNFIGVGIDTCIKKIKKCINDNKIHNLYYYLEMLNELFYSKAVFTYEGKQEDNDFGSDSEIEQEIKKNKAFIYGKKAVIQNGMRALLASLHSGANLLNENYLTSNTKESLYLGSSYYETADALKLLAKFDVKTSISDIKKAKIVIYDTNACEKYDTVPSELQVKQLTKAEVLIIDTTSATTDDYKSWLKKFIALKNVKAIFFAASGLKNEQSADKNPYGTIRVFTKDKTMLNNIVDFIKSKERPIQSGVSHHYRQMMKEIGHVPTNKMITDFFAPKSKPLKSALISDEEAEIDIKTQSSCS